MLRTAQTGPPPKPDIKRAIDGILKEDLNFDRNENRSAHRENLVRPIQIEIRDPEKTVNGFSRNVSATGIGVITSHPIDNNSIGLLKIGGLSNNDTSILSECRWCKPYGEGWYISGWQFINLKR
ncbi:MAG: PilZ domain-containing protein [Mariniblastus sp.]